MGVAWQVGTGIAAVILGVLWWLVPKWQMRSVTTGDPKARADIEDNFRKTVGQALGGIAVLIGAVVAYQTLLVNEDQSRLSQQASHDLLISQQVARGFDQLGSDKMVLRVGGIYALEGVMNGSAQYSGPVLEALCAYVRDGTKTLGGEDPPATDIQAALTVIARRDPTVRSIDLRSAHIPKANLSGADLSGARMQLADLSGANLFSADLNNAYLSGIRLNGAKLMLADLENADLSGASLLDVDLSGADLTGANLSGVTVKQSQLDHACGLLTLLPTGLTLKPCPTRK
jgi:uncharacterized protein YjbI with pentapeptide repeats